MKTQPLFIKKGTTILLHEDYTFAYIGNRKQSAKRTIRISKVI